MRNTICGENNLNELSYTAIEQRDMFKLTAICYDVLLANARVCTEAECINASDGMT
jgi:hypothetical protein